MPMLELNIFTPKLLLIFYLQRDVMGRKASNACMLTEQFRRIISKVRNVNDS